MHWTFLMIAGVLEIGWMISLKLTAGFTRVIPIIFYALFGIGSAFCLSRSLRGGIPIAVAYPIWMGIAFAGATVADIFYFKVKYESLQFVFMALVVVGIIGLQVATKNVEENTKKAPAETLKSPS